MPEAARYMIVLGADVAQAKRGIQEVHEQARGLSEYVRQGFGVGAGVAAFQAGMNAVGGAVKAAKSAMVDFNSDLQKATISFEAMLGSTERAQAYLAQLRDFAARTPFEFPELMKAARGFMNVGIAAESVIPILTRVGDAVAQAGGGREEIEGVSRAIRQMISQGKVQAEEMEQLAERSIPAWKILAEYLGKTEGQVRDMTRAGQVSANQFLQAFDAFYAQARNGAGAMEKMSTTWQGALSTIRDKLRDFGATAFEPIFGRLTALANGIAQALQSEQFQRFTGFVRGLFEMAGAAIDGLLQKLAPLGSALASAFEALTRGDFSGFAAGISSAVDGALNGLLALLRGFGAQLFGAGAEMIGELANGITSAVGSAFSQATTAVAALLEGIIGSPRGEPIQSAQATGAAIGQGVATGVAGQAPAAAAAGQQVAEAVKTSLTLDQIPMDLQGVKDVIAGAADNMGTLGAAGQRVKETVRGISAEMLALQQAIAPLRFQLEDVKASYDAQIQSVRDQLDAVNARHTVGLEEQRLVADLAVLEAQRALEIAKGDQAVRARLDSEIRELQILQQAMQLDERRRQLAELMANPPGTLSPAERALEEFRLLTQLQDWADREAEIRRRAARSQKKQEDDEDDREYRAAQDGLRRQKEEQAAKDRALAAEIRRLSEQEAAVRAKFRDIDLAEEAAANERKRQMREKAFQERMTEIADELGGLDKQQRRVARMGGRGMHDALRAIEKQRKNLLKQQGQLVHSREEEIRTEQEQARKAERRRLMEAELAVLDAQKKSLEEQRQANRAIIAESSAALRRRKQAAEDFEAYDAATQLRRLEREKQLAALQAAVEAERLAKAKAEWERRVAALALALQIAEKEAERDRQGDAAAIRRAEQALRQAEARKRELDLLWAIEEAENRIAAKPLQDRLRELEAARRREVEALEAQIKPLERQLALLSLQRQEWQAVAQAIKDATDKLKEAAKGKQDGLNLGRVEIDTSALDDFKKKLSDGQEAAKAFVNGFGTWIKENLVALAFGGIGALIGGALFGPLGAVAGAVFGFMFGKAVQDKLREWGIDPNAIWPKLQEWLTEMGRLILPRLAQAFDEVRAAVQFLWPYLEKIGRWLWENRETIATMVEWWLKLRLAVWGVALVLGILGTAIGIVFSPITDLLRIFGLLGPATAAGKGAGLLGAAFGKLGSFLGKAWSWLGKLWPLLLRLGPLLNIARFGAIAAGGAISGPFAIALAIAAAAVAGFYLVWRNWDRIKPAIDGMVSWVSDRFSELKAAVLGTFANWSIPDVGGWIKAGWDSLVGFLGELPGRIGQAAQGLWAQLPSFPDLLGMASGAFGSLREFLAGLPERVGGWFSWGRLPSLDIAALLPDVGATVEKIGAFFGGLADGVMEQWTKVTDKLREQSGMQDVMDQWADQFEAGGNDLLAGLLRGLSDVPIIGGIVNAILTVAQKIWNAITSFFGIASPSTLMATAGRDILQGLLNGLESIAQAVVDWFIALPGKLVAAFKAAVAAAGSWGQGIIDGIKAGLNGALGAVTEAATWLGQQVAQKIAEAFTAIGSIAANLGKWISDGMQAAWGAAKSWVEWLVAQITTRFSDGFTAIKNLAAGIGPNLSQGFSLAWGAISSGLTWLVDQIVNPFKAAFGSFKTMAEGVGASIRDGLAGAWNTISPFFTWFRDQLINGGQQALTDLGTKLAGIGTVIADRINGAWPYISSVATSLVNQVGAILGNLVTKATEIGWNLTAALQKAWDDLVTRANNALGGYYNTITTTLNNVNSYVSTRLGELASMAANAWDGVTTRARNTLDGLASTVTNWYSSVQSTLTNVANQVVNGLSSAVSQLTNGLWTASSNIATTIRNAINDTMNWLYQQGTSIWNAAKNLGSQLAYGLTSGIQSAMHSAINAAQQGVQAVMNVIRQILGIASPSKVTTYFGEMVGAGFTQGIENSIADAKRAAADLFAAPQLGPADAGMVASAAAGVGGPAVVNVYVTVEGSVIQQMDMVEGVRQGLVAVAERNGTAGISRVPGL